MANSLTIKAGNVAGNKRISFSITCNQLSNCNYLDDYYRGDKDDDLVLSSSSIVLYTTSIDPEWRCTITKRSGELAISISRPTYPRQQQFKYLYCIPHGLIRPEVNTLVPSNIWKSLHRKLPSNDSEARIIIHEDHVQGNNNQSRYAFDLTLSDSLMSPLDYFASRITTSKDTEVFGLVENLTIAKKTFKDLYPEKYGLMLGLLSDLDSVNVVFVFTINDCERQVGLWAHRIMFTKYPRFQELFKTHCYREEANLPTPIMVPVEGISVTTFCVLLKYIYTDELELVIDPSHFLLCDMEQYMSPPTGVPPTLPEFLNNSLKNRNASRFYASWDTKDKVTWSDLFLAADRFEVAKPREECLKKLLASVNKDNAMEILFGVGMHFREEIHDPVVNYISDHLNNFDLTGSEDPFKRFASHEGCHEVMLKLLKMEMKK
ncbi:hypothetical protein BGX27_001154 [Mortierella sp. AM989]|nr:hypothetical protein BGX27_001154 [Mortierella sp. AM989]